jgi:hypothetical protein
MTSDRLLLALGLLSACADPAPEPDPTCANDDYVPGMSLDGEDGARVTLIELDPAPPARFTNRWTAVVVDAADLAVGADRLTVTTFMPEHGHGGPPVEIGDGGDGALVVDAIELWMPGTWQVDFNITYDGGVDLVRFEVCVDE